MPTQLYISPHSCIYPHTVTYIPTHCCNLPYALSHCVFQVLAAQPAALIPVPASPTALHAASSTCTPAQSHHRKQQHQSWTCGWICCCRPSSQTCTTAFPAASYGSSSLGLLQLYRAVHATSATLNRSRKPPAAAAAAKAEAAAAAAVPAEVAAQENATDATRPAAEALPQPDAGGSSNSRMTAAPSPGLLVVRDSLARKGLSLQVQAQPAPTAAARSPRKKNSVAAQQAAAKAAMQGTPADDQLGWDWEFGSDACVPSFDGELWQEGDAADGSSAGAGLFKGLLARAPKQLVDDLREVATVRRT